jgi:hypothetical protein
MAQKGNWSDEAIKSTITAANERIATADAMTEVYKYPAYDSVLIHFYEEPTTEQIMFMKKRAQKYVYEHRNSIMITGFRKYKRVVVETTEEV